MSNLLEKASILTTPTAYDNGKILSVKPAPSLGSELITNGDFSDGTNGWNAAGGGSISVSNNQLTLEGNNDFNFYARQAVQGFEAGKQYKIEIDVAGGTTSKMQVSLYGEGLFFENQPIVLGKLSAIATITNGVDGSRFLDIYNRNDDGLNDTLILNSVSVKEVIDGDFDFTRNSSATRVNSEGLIEDVQILSSNLVSNGDFSQEGSELITNGDFATDSDWNKINSTISGGAGNLNGTGVTSMLYQNILTNGKTYKVTFTVSDYNSLGEARIIESSGSAIYTITSNGTFTFTFTHSNADGNFLFRARTGAIFSIDNVSVKEVGQDWTLGSGWSIGANKAICDGSDGVNITQNGVIENLKKYKISFNILNYVSGFLNGRIGSANSNDFTVSSDGNYSFNTTSDGTNFVFRSSSFNGSITNVSVIEITDDTNLPRIDYTGGVGHWLFEPQSTNLYLYSEPTTSEGSSGGVTYESFNWVIGFTNCVKYGDNSAARYRYGGTVSASTEYTLSAFVIMDDLSEPIIGGQTSDKDFSLVLGGSVVNPNSSVNMGDNIWRVSSTAITSASPNVGNSGIIKYTAQSNKGFRVVGYQLEQGSFPTSYIPTEGAIKTRLQDAAFGAGSSDLINSTEGVLYAEIASFISTDTTEPNRYLTLTNGTSNQRIALLFGGNNNQLRAIAYSNTQSINLSFSTSLTDTKQFNKLAIKYKSGDYAFFLNGIKIGGSTEANIFTANTLNDLSFDVGGGTQKFRGKTKCLAVFKEALTDAELTCLTTI